MFFPLIFIIKGKHICCDHMFYCVSIYYRNENISGANLLLVRFNVIKYKCYKNENISGANL